MVLKIPCRYKENCREFVTVSESDLYGRGAGLLKPKAAAVQREVLHLECPAGHVERYEIDLHPNGTFTAPTEEK